MLSTRILLQGDEAIQQVLIQWQGKSDEEATWEEKATIQEQFPDFNLEDKVSFEGENIVRKEGRGQSPAGPKPFLVYRRRQTI